MYKSEIQLITFKGCQSAIDFRNQLEDLIYVKDLNVEIRMIIVRSLKKAIELGLYGSPTILVNGTEYQEERRGPPGIYCRAYVTSKGFQPYPLVDEIAAVLAGKPLELPRTESASNRIFPTLITAKWCPFTSSAVEFWTEEADSVGVSMRVLEAESEEGSKLIFSENIAGIPCLIAAPGIMFYGLNISPSEARSFLQPLSEKEGEQ